MYKTGKNDDTVNKIIIIIIIIITIMILTSKPFTRAVNVIFSQVF